MGNKVSVELKGLNSLLDKARALLPQVRQRVGDTVAEWLLLVETDAKLYVAVDTGRLRASIHSEQAANRLSGFVGTNVEYAPYQEFGTRYIPARPFIFPAYEKNRPAFMALLKKNLKLF